MTMHTEHPDQIVDPVHNRIRIHATPLFDFSTRWEACDPVNPDSPLFAEVNRIVRDKHQTVLTPDEWVGLLAALAELPPRELLGDDPVKVPDMFAHPDLAGVELQAALTGVAENLAALIGLHGDAYRIAVETRDLMRLLAFRADELRKAADLRPTNGAKP